MDSLQSRFLRILEGIPKDSEGILLGFRRDSFKILKRFLTASLRILKGVPKHSEGILLGFRRDSLEILKRFLTASLRILGSS